LTTFGEKATHRISFTNRQPEQLRFGTSGLRGLVETMTDLECYINVKGYIEYLKRIGKDRGGIEEGATICVAGDLRSSTDRIMGAVARAIEGSGCKVSNCGKIPTSALVYYAMQNGCASMMVTGSHTPDDRNGIKPNKTNGEVLKSDESGIVKCITQVRGQEYARLGMEASIFTQDAMFKTAKHLPEVNAEARQFYIERYLKVFPHDCLKDRRIVVYEHSAVGRDIMVEILQGLGAEVIREGRSDNRFIPVDTEAVRQEDLESVAKWAQKHRPFAVVSMDGDSDRPWLSDESGKFLRGDILGLIAALYLGADFAAIPVSSNDAIDMVLKDEPKLVRTKIGSPYIIAAMLDALRKGFRRVVGWEANGGFLTQSDISINGKPLKALPTRDSVLPLICALLLALRKEKSLSQLIETFPKRFTYADLLKEFPTETGRAIVRALSLEIQNMDTVRFDDEITIIREGREKEISKTDPLGIELWEKKKRIEERYFAPEGFDTIAAIGFVDGVRIVFRNQDIIHFRPSGNAPEFRCYSNAGSPERAGEIVRLGLGSIVPRIRNDLETKSPF
jgi:phosphomannomutase